MPEPANERRDVVIPTYKSTLTALGVVFVVYVVLLACGLPQKWTRAQFTHHEEAEVAATESVGVETVDSSDAKIDANIGEKRKEERKEEAKDAHNAEETRVPPLWTSAPFVILLLCIAILPLIPKVERWWESNLIVLSSRRSWAL